MCLGSYSHGCVCVSRVGRPGTGHSISLAWAAWEVGQAERQAAFLVSGLFCGSSGAFFIWLLIHSLIHQSRENHVLSMKVTTGTREGLRCVSPRGVTYEAGRAHCLVTASRGPGRQLCACCQAGVFLLCSLFLMKARVETIIS